MIMVNHPFLNLLLFYQKRESFYTGGRGFSGEFLRRVSVIEFQVYLKKLYREKGVGVKGLLFHVVQYGKRGEWNA